MSTRSVVGRCFTKRRCETNTHIVLLLASFIRDGMNTEAVHHMKLAYWFIC